MSRVAELTSVLAKKTAEIQQFAENGIKVDGDKVEVKSEDAAAVRKLMAECEEIKGFIDVELFGPRLERWKAERGIDKDGQFDEKSFAQMMAAQTTDLRHLQEHSKTLGELFTDSREFKSLIETKGVRMPVPFELKVADITRNSASWMERKDVYGALNPQTITQGVGTVIQFDPTVPRGRRPNRVRDLFPQAGTSANLIDYFQVVGFNEGPDNGSPVGGRGNAQTVADYSAGAFGTKPQSNLQFRPQQAPVRTIAHWEAAHRNVLQDVPQLQSTINNELMYGLQLVEDDQILNGDGTGENLTGILQTQYVQNYTAPNEIKSDSLRKAATLSMLANYPATGYVLHPYDWEQIELQKGTGDGQYMLFNNIAIGARTIAWRLPVVETPAIAQQTFLTGAFGTGAQLYDRMEANIRIADQHGNFFIQNALAILCEQRLALTVKRPESFVIGTFYTA